MPPAMGSSEDLPDPNNRVTLDRDDNIVLQYKPNNEEGHKRLIAKLERLMQQQTKCPMHGHECHEGRFGRHERIDALFSSESNRL